MYWFDIEISARIKTPKGKRQAKLERSETWQSRDQATLESSLAKLRDELLSRLDIPAEGRVVKNSFKVKVIHHFKVLNVPGPGPCCILTGRLESRNGRYKAWDSVEVS